MTTEPIRLTGLDGSNPLAFLAAVGTLRLLSLNTATAGARMRWVEAGVWQPELLGLEFPPKDLAQILLTCPQAPVSDLMEKIGANLTVDPEEKYRPVVAEAALDRGRIMSDFLAAFGCEAIPDDKKPPRIKYTNFCFITGSGHQDFLKTAHTLKKAVTAQDLDAALFRPWERANQKNMSFRWDPQDAAEYALQWDDPSSQGAATVPGANWLAFEALPAFPTHPGPGRLTTTAFAPGGRGRFPQFRWPIWDRPTSFPTLRSLLGSAALADTKPQDSDLNELAARGVIRIYSADRVRIGQGANFKVSFRPAAALA